MTANRTPAGVPTGGQFAASARNEADVDLVAPARHCFSCHKPLTGSCTNPTCDDFDMTNPAAVFTGVDIRAHALQPGDIVTFDGQSVAVTSVDVDPPGRSGRQATIHTDAGRRQVGINTSLPTSRNAPAEPQPEARVAFDWEPAAYGGGFEASSSSGWGSKATIVPPEDGDGETFYWEVRQGGWTWDGREETLEAAQVAAASEANRMLTMQENEPGGFDWDADDEEDDDDEFGW